MTAIGANLYVVTHPESTHHTEHLVGGWYDSQLTEAGLRAAGSIAAALRTRIPLADETALYSSDLLRTRQTAEVIGDRLGANVTVDRGLREKSYGVAEGKPQAWLDERFLPPPLVGDRMHHHDGVPGAETKWTFASRVYASMDRMLEDRCQHPIIVTHGFAATIIVAWWIKMPMEALGYVDFRLSAGSITDLRQDDYLHNRQVIRLNDVTHLCAP